ncbi:ethanolamine utilization protein EutS [Lachnospiraceae bacterium KH1T2]|jgi:ethanolamine utilization protein EutS|nr:ethanolamine utilization protein EutS [Lachnospiraceae bacterium KH1T2]
MIEQEQKIRIVQETVCGKEITLAHVISGPSPIIYRKLGLDPSIDYHSAAIGIMDMTPPESAIIASDIAVKSGDIYLGFADRFTGTLIITGQIEAVTSAIQEVISYFNGELGYVTCPITKR